MSEAVSDAVHLLEEVDAFYAVVEHIDLVVAVDEAAEFYADESDELTALVDFVEELEGVLAEGIVLGGVRDFVLLGEGVEICVSDFYGYAGG